MKDHQKIRVWDGEKFYYLQEDGFFWSDIEGGNCLTLDEVMTYHEFSEMESCTGIKDKNGKLIYEEGDIYKLPDGSTGPMHRILAAYLVSKSHLLGAPHKVYEIIGNIHENPELLGLPPKQ